MRPALVLLIVTTTGMATLVTLGSPSSEGLRDPAALVATGLWWVAIVAAGYLMALAGAAVVAQAVRATSLLTALRVLTVPALRSIVLPAALASSRLLVASPAGANEPSNAPATVTPAVMVAPAVMVVVEDPTAPPPLLMVWRDHTIAAADPAPADPSNADGSPTIEPSSTVEINESASTPATGSGAGSATDLPIDAAQDAQAATQVHIVAPGEHCWSIATDQVAARLGTTPTVAEVARYWRQLLTVNQDRFVTGDPDLIIPGQQLLLPQ